MPNPAHTPAPGRFPRLPALAGLLLALGLLAACSPHRELYPRLQQMAAEGRYAEAAETVEEARDEYGERNEVLWNLDRGLLYHYAGEYEASNEAFAAAERRMDELFTESITGNVLAFGVNDNTLPYRGEDFEQVIVNIYRALNYAKLGQVDDALVEARKVDRKLRYINDQYDEGEKNAYTEDGFARMLAGVFYEMGETRDDLNDAFISNRLAAETYGGLFSENYGVQAPPLLQENLLSTATFMGDEELERARERYPQAELVPPAERRQRAQVVVVHFAGRSPVKVQDGIAAVMPDGNVFSVAFPRYQRRSYTITGARLRVDGQAPVPLQVAHPLGDIAVENLQNRKGRIAVKAIARATTKYVANRALQQQAREESEALGLLAYVAGNVATVASEQADLRAWELLPDRVLVGRALVPPGTHRVRVAYTTSGGGAMAEQDLGEITLQPGQIRFIILHTNT